MERKGVDDRDLNGFSELHRSAMDGDERGLISSLRKGIDINIKDSSGYTALYWALSKGEGREASILIEKGAALDKVTYNKSALEVLTQFGDKYSTKDLDILQKKITSSVTEIKKAETLSHHESNINTLFPSLTVEGAKEKQELETALEGDTSPTDD